MKIGFTCQGSTDEAFLNGVKERICPSAELIRSDCRGSTRQSLKREIPAILTSLFAREAEVCVILTDSDNQNYRTVKKSEVLCVPVDFKLDVVYGVAQRNVECWLTANPSYCAQVFGSGPPRDPKSRKLYFEKSMGITSWNFKKDEIIDYVKKAPLKSWNKNSKSFGDFYDDLKVMANQKKCANFKDIHEPM